MEQGQGTRTTGLSADDALNLVTSSTGKGVYASADTLFKGAVFGRDSLEVAEDLLDVKPHLVRHILLTLASLQGVHASDATEEEAGKIVHEYRTAVVDGRPLDKTSQIIFDELAGRWGGTAHSLAYYGTVDATPHFIRVLGAYCRYQEGDFLAERVQLQNGQTITMADSLQAAVSWLSGKLETSSSGLLEYQRRNPRGIENQVWKDSVEFYVHADGTVANHKAPIASIEVQGLAYDALRVAAEFIPERKDEFKKRAQTLRERAIALLWSPLENYFALGIDHAEDGNLRTIATKTANPAALLDSMFFDDLEPKTRKLYVEAIIRVIMSDDFLTDAGIRSRALSQTGVIAFWDYHGSYVCWPKETYDIAKGLRRQGFPDLAVQLENRILNVVRKSGTYPEFVYVDGQGRVLMGEQALRGREDVLLIDSTNKPERVQAWTVSAVLAILADHIHGLTGMLEQNTWEYTLEKELLKSMRIIAALQDKQALSKQYPDYPYRLVKERSFKSGNFLHDKLDPQ